MSVALITIVPDQTKGTEATAQAITQLLNYTATHTDTTTCFKKSTCISMCTAMPHICLKWKPEAVPAEISFSVPGQKTHPNRHLHAMAPYTLKSAS
jgi:hypothetical protein